MSSCSSPTMVVTEVQVPLAANLRQTPPYQLQQQPKKKSMRSFLLMIYLYIRATLRILFIIANNLYCLPTYLVWMTMLWPLKIINSKMYYKVEGIFYHWLLNMITVWGHSAGYGVMEYGDQPEMYFEHRALVISNHQSTGDVPVLMAAFNAKPMVVPNIMWVMDAIFKFTNFGIVCSYHQDFFIESGPERREEAVVLLKEHLATKYIQRNRRWLVLFPEGGFLKKRIVKGQQYAQRNNLPILHNITLPRLGALNGIRDILVDTEAAANSAELENKGGLLETKGIFIKPEETGLSMEADVKLEYLIDMTVAYPDPADPLDVLSILNGIRPPCDTHLYYRIYPINQIPTGDEEMKNWFYDRFIEKEHMLETFYRTNAWPTDSQFYRHSVSSGPPRRNSQVTGRRVKHDNLRSFLLHLAFLLSTYLHVQMFIGLAYLWTRAMKMVWKEDEE